MRIAGLLAVLLFAAPTPDLVVLKGRRFDVVTDDAKVGGKLLKHADEVGDVFVGLLDGFPGKRGAVLLEVEADDKLWKKNGATWTTARLAEDDEYSVDTFRYELAKTLLERQMEGKVSKKVPKRFAEFASPLPDWLDEGIAGLHRELSAKKEERDLLGKGEVADKFEELFEKEHPLNEVPKEVKEGADVVIVMGMFCLQSQSLCEFLVVRYGDEGLRHVVETVAKGKSVKAALPGLRKLRKGKRPKKEKPVQKISDLEKVWKDWLKG